MLKNSVKEKAENTMIVDLMRNDLSKIAINNSVKVEELCGIYTFEQVHQMISTVVANIREDISPVEVIQNCFPMGFYDGGTQDHGNENSRKI